MDRNYDIEQYSKEIIHRVMEYSIIQDVEDIRKRENTSCLVSESETDLADESGTFESNFKQNIHLSFNYEKDVVDDNEQNVTECINKNTEFSETSDECNVTEQSSVKFDQEKELNVPLTSAEITSRIYKDYKKRPSRRAFIELERYSLVSEVIYEEEEPKSEDDGSESDCSIHSDTIFVDYEECNVNISATDVSDNCNIENNESVIAEEEKYVANMSQLVENSKSNTSLDVKLRNSNLPIKEASKVSDEFHPLNTFSNVFEEEENPPKSSEVNKENITIYF
ncbi:uncharacterized protein LOC111613132 [Centruroides sculpturatus]|uniref:uncharacterized protein LOC111613132 n=1 Tax=Centruroides sculpturatus TaxID=218467 RepID=UPI000C6E57BE|nr:uncharacterized protein LOC111613132 [Centruroides sculpturatus]